MRVTLILPRHRLWRWHIDLIESLRAKGAEVLIRLDDRVPPYARGLRAWLALERLRLGACLLAEPVAVDPDWPDFTTQDPGDDRVLVNLSERGLVPERALALRVDGALCSDALIGALLRRRQPTLEVGRGAPEPALARSRPAMEDRSYLSSDLERCFSRAVSLILRALDRTAVPPVPARAESPEPAPIASHTVHDSSASSAADPAQHPHPEVAARSVALEGALQKPPRSLEGSFEAAFAAPQDEGEDGKAARSFQYRVPCASRSEAAPDPRSAVHADDEPASASSRGALASFACRSVIGKGVSAALRPVRHPDHWTTALRMNGGPFRPIDEDGERYFADPFLIDWDGTTILFVEEFEHASGRGHIAAAQVRGDRLLAPPVPVLRRPHHLSYPLVFSSHGSRFMIPESGANRSVDLYRSDAGPWSWEKVGSLLEGRVFADATPLFHRGLWWLFVAADDHGTATQDELQIHVSERLTGPYRPHPMNPVRSDCRFARPAGRIRRHGGRLLRPAQDCQDNYGAGIAWFVIRELTPTAYREELLTVWNGPRDAGVRGLHSFDQLGGVQAIDLNGPMRRGRLRPPPPMPSSGGVFEAAFLAQDETAAMFSGATTA